MQQLVAPTENFILGETTLLSADEAANQTVLSVESTTGFSVNDYIAINILGSETAELRQISIITANSLTISTAISYNHTKGSRLTRLLYNQRKFYRSTSKDGVYSHLTNEGSPKDIEVDSAEGTQFEDSSGSVTSWYKATYYNSTSGVETSTTDGISTKAGDSEFYTTLYKIKSEAGFVDNSYISSEVVNRYREEAQAEINATLASVYVVPFEAVPILITHITTMLAAGLLLSKEYGVEVDIDIAKSGEKKIERANELLKKIVDGILSLVDSNNNIISKLTSYKVSGSNSYADGVYDKGELFNLELENFKLTDPTNPTTSSDRTSSNKTTNWSQK